MNFSIFRLRETTAGGELSTTPSLRESLKGVGLRSVRHAVKARNTANTRATDILAQVWLRGPTGQLAGSNSSVLVLAMEKQKSWNKLVNCVGYSMRAAIKLDVPSEVQVYLRTALQLLINPAMLHTPADSLPFLASSGPIPIQLFDVLGISDAHVGDVVQAGSPIGTSVDTCALDACRGSEDSITQTRLRNQDAAQKEPTGIAQLSQYLHEEDYSPAGSQNPEFDEDPAALLQHVLSMASSAEEALQGLRHLRAHYRHVIRMSPPSPSHGTYTAGQTLH